MPRQQVSDGFTKLTSTNAVQGRRASGPLQQSRAIAAKRRRGAGLKAGSARTRQSVRTAAGELTRAELGARAGSRWALLDTAAAEEHNRDIIMRRKVLQSNYEWSVVTQCLRCDSTVEKGSVHSPGEVCSLHTSSYQPTHNHAHCDNDARWAVAGQVRRWLCDAQPMSTTCPFPHPVLGEAGGGAEAADGAGGADGRAGGAPGGGAQGGPARS